MADYVFTASGIARPDTQSSVDFSHNAGAAINPGQAVYFDTASNTWKIANALTSLTTSKAQGIAISGASAAGQPIAVLTAGNLTCNGLTAQKIYCLSGATGGALADVADLVTNIATWHGCIMGIATSATNLIVAITPSGI